MISFAEAWTDFETTVCRENELDPFSHRGAFFAGATFAVACFTDDGLTPARLQALVTELHDYAEELRVRLGPPM